MRYSVTIDRVEVKSVTFDIECDDEDTAIDIAHQKAHDVDFNTLSGGSVEYETAEVTTFIDGDDD